MPAKDLSSGNTFYHVFNRGVEKRIIFDDSQDYETFEGFLRDYLTPPADPESVKKDFTVNGRNFRGTPHLPKNYHGKIELIAYSLMPNHFHLILNPKSDGSLESFIRSLCTRYSMYFNKKHNRTGSLFEGPYKSVQIREKDKLYALINYIHHGTNDFSSYPEYSGKRKTSWISNDSILSDTGYKKNKSDISLTDGLLIEDESQPLERRNLTEKVVTVKKNESMIPGISAAFAVFLVLTGLGLRNIKATEAKNLAASVTTPPVLSETIEISPAPAVSKTMVVVDIIDTSATVIVRQEPTVNSLKVGEAKNGDSFEFVAVNSGWYEVKLPDSQTGYIDAKFTHLEEVYINE